MTHQYYFSIEELQKLKNKFPSDVKGPEGKTLKGFVFTPALTEEGKRIFAFPLFSNSTKKGGIDGDLLQQNLSVGVGCPYPPKCKLGFDGEDSCYDK